jgi:uncharacterized protein (DUF1501 family)
MLRRRDLLRLVPAGLLAGLPRLARADVPGSGRRFLFVFAEGGWDPLWALAPEFDNPNVDMPADGQLAEQGGHRWVTSPSRPSVDAFFTRHGARTCVLHGLEIPSIAHDRAARILLTGSSSNGVNDFATTLAMASPTHLALAHVVMSGPAYTDGSASHVVRLGESSQLYGLVDGSGVTDAGLRVPTDAVGALEDAWVEARVRAAAASAGRGAASRMAAAYEQALVDAATLPGIADALVVASDDAIDQMRTAVGLLGDGLARCAIIADKGFENLTWDHHSEITRQGPSYESLFRNLATLLDEMAATPGTLGETLLDEVTVVVCSEMGRYPKLNGSLGKDHWMTTSLLLAGGGVRGGQIVGAYDADMGATPIVPETGELDPDGTRGGVVPASANVGATLLALAGLDPAESFGSDVLPLEALIDP